MLLPDCKCKSVCTVYAILSAVCFGFAAAVLRLQCLFVFKPVFLWNLLGISAAYLAVLVVAAVLDKKENPCLRKCTVFNTLLAAVLGSVLFSALLLGVGSIAPTVLSAVLGGILVAFFSLTVTSTACLVKFLVLCHK